VEYVVGFRIDPNKGRVVLVRKEKPAWQRGFLNGVGGKIEEGETPEQAISREFWEEAGVEVTDWEKTIVLTGEKFQVSFFRSFGDVESVRAMTDEKIVVHHIGDLSALAVIPNLRWLIPMQLDDTLLWPVHIKDIAVSEDAHVGN
jgi:8-oxo-dGTP diphosphatase